VKEKTKKICHTANKQNAYASKYVEEQERVKEHVDELCVIAVEQNGSAFEYIKNQRYEII